MICRLRQPAMAFCQVFAHAYIGSCFRGERQSHFLHGQTNAFQADVDRSN